MPPSRICLFQLSVCLLLSVGTATSPQAPCVRRTLTRNVFDGTGGLVRGLEPANFEAKLGGKYVSMLSFGSVSGMSDWERRLAGSDPIEIPSWPMLRVAWCLAGSVRGLFEKIIYDLKAGEGKATGNLLASCTRACPGTT